MSTLMTCGQGQLFYTRAFTGRIPKQRKCTRIRSQYAASPPEDVSGPTRRAAGLLLTALPAILAPAARALIPDDEDEELVNKAKANRRNRLKNEKQVEKEYVKVAGFDESDLFSVQKAVNRLAKSGGDLDAGNLPAVAAAVKDAWVSDLERAVKELSSSDAAKRSAEGVKEGLAGLGASAGSGDLGKAKDSFVAAVSALQTWVGDAGIAQSIKGL